MAHPSPAAGTSLHTPAPAAGPTTLFEPVPSHHPAAGIPTVLARMRVLGIPEPEGSKVPFVDKGGRAHVRATNAKALASWRHDVSLAAEQIREGLDATLDGPLVLEVTFRFPMPASRRKAVRMAGQCFKETAPDADKLVRAVGDALEAAGLITNDARFVIVHVCKLEVLDAWTGADITIRRPV